MAQNQIPFVKMNGIGNEIIIADIRGAAAQITTMAAISLAKDPVMHFDQIMEIADPRDASYDQDIRILNADGSTAQACGNGTRCVVAWLHRTAGEQNYVFRTEAGLIKSNISASGAITVDMGSPRFGWEAIPLAEEFGDTTGIELQIGPIDAPILHTPSVVNIGNPHAVFWVGRDPEEYDLERIGPLLENHPIFPERANISVARVLDPNLIQVRTWERGAGLTKACGSAACAALVCAARMGLAARNATVRLPGGELEIEWTPDNRVLMSGPVTFEFAGTLDPLTGQYQREQEKA